MLQYDIPLTQEELIEQNIYLKTVCRGQAASIAYLNEENEQLINDALRLAADNDRLTIGLFESPYLHTSEHIV